MSAINSELQKLFRFSDEVSTALSEGQPLVALESTIITHGMPWPDNIETARRVEATVKKAGAVPATIAVLNGHIHVGLNPQQLEQLAQENQIMKLSRADLAACIAMKKSGSTTVAATMIIAALAGITVFATGGIGGVHRDAERSLDISADLNELARTDVNVICAGAKAILDLPKTLEYLETLGVPVVGWQCDELPAFWSRTSGLRAPLRFDEMQTLVSFIRLRRSMSLGGGVLITNPVPATAEIPAGELAGVIDQALNAAGTRAVSGKDVTPFLLAQVLESTGGRSLQTNIALIENNALLAAQLAVSLGTSDKSS